MPSKSVATRALAAIAAASAISLSTPHFLPSYHPINQVWSAAADEDEFEDEIEEDIEDEIDEDLDDEIDDEIEDDLDDVFEDEIELEFEEAFEEFFEDDEEDEFEDEFDEEIDEEIEEDEDEFDDDDTEDEDLDEPDEDDEDPEDEEDLEEEGASEEEEQELPSTFFELEFDEDGDAFASNEFLILGPSDEIDAIIEAGLITENVSELESLDLQLVRVTELGSRSFDDLEALIFDIAPNAEVDVNHLYLEQSNPTQSSANDLGPLSVSLEVLSEDEAVSIGLIDTRLNLQTSALENSRIVERDFVTYQARRPELHGTAIASILVGKDASFSGLLPNAQLYAASVFFETPSGGSSATTDSLVSALDWLVASDVEVINMSLSGPPNTVLARAISQVQSEGISIVAAVGNDGPAAPPRYPAAYEGVIGVTAVSSQKTVFRRAGRGDHIDFSAYGVDVPHAGPTGEIDRSTGTSFAAPFVSANFALAASMLAPENLFEAFAVTAEDLGPQGHDPIYGHGLLQPLDHYQTAAAERQKD